MGDQHQRAKEKAARLLKERKDAAALEIFRAIVAEDPAELGCWAKIGELSQAAGQTQAAVDAFRRVADRLAKDGFLLKAITVCKQILELEPAHTETQEMLASLYAAKRTPAEARVSQRPKRREPAASTQLRDLVSVAPSRPSLPAEDDASAMPRTPLFSDLPPEAFREILEGMTRRHVNPGACIIKEGEHGHSFFVLVSGRMRVEKSSELQPILLAHLGEGAFFGEMALLQDGARTASVYAEEESEILELDRALLEGLVARHPLVAKVLRDFYQQRLLTTAMAVHPFFQPFTPSERRMLGAQFQARAFAAGEVLIKEGDRGQGLYLLLSGALEVSSTRGGVLATLGPGEMVGEMSLLRDARTNATVCAREESWVLRLSREHFRSVAGERPEVLDLLERLVEDRLDVNRTVRNPPPGTGDIII